MEETTSSSDQPPAGLGAERAQETEQRLVAVLDRLSPAERRQRLTALDEAIEGWQNGGGMPRHGGPEDQGLT